MKQIGAAALAAMMFCISGCSGAGDRAEGSAAQQERAQSLAFDLDRAADDVPVGSYRFPLPDGWIPEVDPLPPPWDPSFPFTGTEELRFPQGWPDPTSPEWWAYSYMLWVDSGPSVTSSVLEQAVVGYYKGLMSCGDEIPCDRFAAKFTQVIRSRSASVFIGQADIYDLVKTPITLDMLVTSVVCSQSKHRALVFSVAPVGASEAIWKQLLDLQLQFRCR